MEYEEMTDAQIDALVAKSIYGEKLDRDIARIARAGGLRYCTEPAIAWPLIVEHKITVEAPMSYEECQKWAASSEETSFDWAVTDANPLRAAMTVYLYIIDRRKRHEQ